MNQLPFFVYGTLLKGHGNYARYLAGKTMDERDALTSGSLFAVHGGAFPALLQKPCQEGAIKGELMYVKPEYYEEVLKNLDRLEGFREKDPENSMYLRKVQMVMDDKTGKMIDAWVYYWNSRVHGFKQILSGSFNEFCDSRKPRRKGLV